MIADVIDATRNYIQTTPSDKRLVIIEGIHKGAIPKWQDLSASLQTNGEMGATSFIAQEAGTEVISGEAPQSEIINRLKEIGISSDDIATFYSLRDVPDLIRKRNITPENVASLIYDKSLEAGADWTSPFTKQDMEKLQDDPDFRQAKVNEVLTSVLPKLNLTINRLISDWFAELDESSRGRIKDGTHSSKEIENTVFQKLLSVAENASSEEKDLIRYGNNDIEIGLDSDTLTYLTKPGNEAPNTKLRKISRFDNEARDDYLLNTIDTSVKEGKSPLVVFGGTHAIKIAPALTYLFQSDKGSHS